MPKTKDGLWVPDGGIEAYELLPSHLRAGTRYYIEEGKIPGGFLVAVICNDLINAVTRADSESCLHLRDIALWFYNEAPGPCRGSWSKMKDWSSARIKERIEERNADTD